jgi:hypothetical protein
MSNRCSSHHLNPGVGSVGGVVGGQRRGGGSRDGKQEETAGVVHVDRYGELEKKKYIIATLYGTCKYFTKHSSFNV